MALLLLRVYVGAMMAFNHGLPKLLQYSEKSGGFPDPLGIGNELSLVLTIIAEFFCSLALFFGIFTRVVLVPLIITMAMAAFVIHADDSLGTKELSLMYLVPYLVVFIAGPGKYSVDRWLFNKN